jgi:hypothetical protein
VAPVAPAIQNVTVSPRNVTFGGNTTLTIRTNNDVEHVWVRDIDGREHNASRTTTTANARNWTVTFNPLRTGNVTVFANTDRTTDGAVQRTENINVGTARASLVSANANWMAGNDVRFSATTNADAATVWATLGDGRRIQLHQTNVGATGNRNWEAWASHVPTGNIVMNASSTQGNIHNLTPDDTRNVHWGGHAGGGHIGHITHSGPSSANRGGSVSFRVRASANVTHFTLASGSHGNITGQWPDGVLINNNTEQYWIINVSIHQNAPVGQNLFFTINALNNNVVVGTQQTPATTVNS